MQFFAIVPLHPNCTLWYVHKSGEQVCPVYNCWHKGNSFKFITTINEYELILLILKGKIALDNTVLLLTSSHQLFNLTFGTLSLWCLTTPVVVIPHR